MRAMLTRDDLVLCNGSVERAGFRGISLWPHVYRDARASGHSDADLRHMLDDHGVEIAEHDALLRWLPVPAELATGPLFQTCAEDFFRIADAVGGRSLNVAQAFPSGIDIDAAAAALAPVCEGAAACGLAVSLEFLPWSDVPDPATALEVVLRTGQQNAGIMVDSWHVFRGVGDVAAVGALPGERIVGIQLNDAPAQAAESPIVETLEARLVPGEGAIDLEGLLRALDATGTSAPVGVEVYSKALAGQAPGPVAKRLGDATRAVLARARS
jgi:sugar phosphate isomerase/epimerase